MVDIMSLVNSGGQVSLQVTPGDLLHFAQILISETRKEWENELASAHKEEPEEEYLSTEEVCKIFNVCQATLWDWHRKGYLCHVKWGSKNMYPLSAVNAIRYARSLNETVSGYCKRKSKVDDELLPGNLHTRKEADSYD